MGVVQPLKDLFDALAVHVETNAPRPDHTASKATTTKKRSDI
jgi:hypothetical protein